jgi:MYXO-CTERM domain-containing protein
VVLVASDEIRSTTPWHDPRKDGTAMLRRLALLATLIFAAPNAFAADDDGDATACSCDATPAACDTGCACDSECEVDWTVDECSLPGADCEPETEITPEALSAAETADLEVKEPIDWTVAASDVRCASGSTNVDGTCVPGDAIAAGDAEGGCSSGTTPGLVIGLAVVAVFVVARRRRLLLAAAFAACSIDSSGWDQAVDDGPTGDRAAYLDVFSADLGDAAGSQYLLEHQQLAAGAEQPVAEFSLLRDGASVPVFRAAQTCGDRLVTAKQTSAELLGWARADAGDGTAALVELAAPDGCAFAYEIDPETIDTLVGQGYTVVGTIAHVWPPGMGDPIVVEPPATEPELTTIAAPAPCKVDGHSPVVLLYASPGKVETLRFLLGCPGEVIIGEKREGGPVGSMKSPEAQLAGGRTAFVLDRNGDKLRALLNRKNGLERTVQYLKHKLAIGYDYIVIDEITAASDFRDGTSLNHKIRKLLLRLPARKVIPYISIDLTQYPNGFSDMKARRYLLRAFKKRARALALEVYLHTPQVIAGQAPGAFRRAADRLALAVKGMKDGGGINRRAFTTIGTSIHAGTSGLAQYMYLDRPHDDLRAVKKEVNALRHGSKRVRSQKGIGFYFVNKSDMAPRGGVYSYEKLIRTLRLQALRFK